MEYFFYFLPMYQMSVEGHEILKSELGWVDLVILKNTNTMTYLSKQ